MEYVEGVPVRALLDQPLDPEQGFAICIQVAKAMEAAHARGVAHRDVKPDNLMVRPDGQVKVLDFGLAGSPDFGDGNTPLGALSGTPRYMSPEQCKSLPAGTESDIFSLGVIFYEMITGVHPFAAKSIMETMEAIVNDTPALPSKKCGRAVPKGLDALILVMLDKRPERRPAAGQVIREMRKLELANRQAMAREQMLKAILLDGLAALRARMSKLVQDALFTPCRSTQTS
jgi:serine/threonine-protein kinase